MSARIPSSQGYNNIHMWDFSDLRSSRPAELCTPADTVYDYISRHPHMKKFASIIARAGMIGALSEKQFDTTLLAPLDTYLPEPQKFFDNMDRGQARRIIAVSTLNSKIDGQLLRSSPVSSFATKDPYNANYMYVTNISGVTRINQCATVIEYDIRLGNGILHITDNIILPNYEHFIY